MFIISIILVLSSTISTRNHRTRDVKYFNAKPVEKYYSRVFTQAMSIWKKYDLAIAYMKGKGLENEFQCHWDNVLVKMIEEGIAVTPAPVILPTLECQKYDDEKSKYTNEYIDSMAMLNKFQVTDNDELKAGDAKDIDALLFRKGVCLSDLIKTTNELIKPALTKGIYANYFKQSRDRKLSKLVNPCKIPKTPKVATLSDFDRYKMGLRKVKECDDARIGKKLKAKRDGKLTVASKMLKGQTLGKIEKRNAKKFTHNMLKLNEDKIYDASEDNYIQMKAKELVPALQAVIF